MCILPQSAEYPERGAKNLKILEVLKAGAMQWGGQFSRRKYATERMIVTLGGQFENGPRYSGFVNHRGKRMGRGSGADIFSWIPSHRESLMAARNKCRVFLDL